MILTTPSDSWQDQHIWLNIWALFLIFKDAICGFACFSNNFQPFSNKRLLNVLINLICHTNSWKYQITAKLLVCLFSTDHVQGAGHYSRVSTIHRYCEEKNMVYLPPSYQDSTPHLISPPLTLPLLTPNCGLTQTLADISGSEPTSFFLQCEPASGRTSSVTIHYHSVLATFFSHPFNVRLTEQIRFYFNQYSGLHRPPNSMCFTSYYTLRIQVSFFLFYALKYHDCVLGCEHCQNAGDHTAVELQTTSCVYANGG